MARFVALWVIIFGISSCQSVQLREPAGGDTQASESLEPQPLFLCSFNIQFLGSSRIRKDEALAQILREQGCDLVAIQELVAPPDLRQIPSSPHYGGDKPATFPNEERHRPKKEVTRFFLAMHEQGYDGFLLSEEDTGRAAKNRNNGSATEWWVTFFRTEKLQLAPDLPHGFLSKRVSANPTWDRVPYAFPFRTVEGGFDFVLVSVHLRPGTGPSNRARRKEELRGIHGWILDQHKLNSERDYVILGDMNLYNAEELDRVTPPRYLSLNTKARFATNTNRNSPQPYDHVMVNPSTTPEIPVEENFFVLNLVELGKSYWDLDEPYPGDPYRHNAFRFYLSDHHPVGFWVYPTHLDRD